MRIYAAVGVALFMLCVSCTTVDLSKQTFDPKAFYFVNQPNERQLKPDLYFKHEYRQINARHGTAELDSRPPLLVGLAFSGGGIRSAAFQFGLLSGLHAAPNILARVDYISSVS